MNDKELYAQILEMRCPRRVTDVELLTNTGEVKIYAVPEPETVFACPTCIAA